MVESIAAGGIGAACALLGKIIFDWLKNGRKAPSPRPDICIYHESLDGKLEALKDSSIRAEGLLVQIRDGINAQNVHIVDLLRGR